ncbi:hypothetical protein CRG98_005459 [Punica granatum]|uniref:Uncharacterized protein n=1 Tax=Punica granatum TaxID=22663 RepID=A0A2I0L0H1_PUNGR|nr:hypothetical protein CRG98_005459 [Punica granatum]
MEDRCAISVVAGQSSSSPALAIGILTPSSSNITITYIPILSSVSTLFHESGGPATLPIELHVFAPENHDRSTDSVVSAEDTMGNDVAPVTQNTHMLTTRSKDGTLPPCRFIISRHPSAFSISAALQEPRTFTQARKHSNCREAMEEEYLALLHNHTWNLVLSSLA